MTRLLTVLTIALAATAAAYTDVAQDQQTDSTAVATAISETMRVHHYDPAELELPG